MLYDNLELKDFFTEILSEIWLDLIPKEDDEKEKAKKKKKQKFKNFVKDINNVKEFKEDLGKITFDYKTIENVLFYKAFEDHCYLIAKCPDYYILATQQDVSIYPTTSIIKNGLLTPLIPHMKHFKEMVPGTTATNFVKAISLNNKIELLLEEKETKPVKTKKL